MKCERYWERMLNEAEKLSHQLTPIESRDVIAKMLGLTKPTIRLTELRALSKILWRMKYSE